VIPISYSHTTAWVWYYCHYSLRQSWGFCSCFLKALHFFESLKKPWNLMVHRSLKKSLCFDDFGFHGITTRSKIPTVVYCSYHIAQNYDGGKFWWMGDKLIKICHICQYFSLSKFWTIWYTMIGSFDLLT